LVNNSSGANVGGNCMPGDGLTIDLPTGALIATSTFNVLASNGSCSIQLTTSSTVNVTATPNLSLSTPARQCHLFVLVQAHSIIQVAGSESGVTYELRDAVNTECGRPMLLVLVVQSSLPTGALAAAATFNVFASSASCGSGEYDKYRFTVSVGTGTINASLTIVSTGVVYLLQVLPHYIQVSNSEVGVSYSIGQQWNRCSHWISSCWKWWNSQSKYAEPFRDNHI